MKGYKWHYNFTRKQIQYMKLKRFFDIILAQLLLVLLAPVMMACILFIKLESPGPAIFKQMRPGYKEKIFAIYKFRTMRIDTIWNGKALTDMERLTRIGRILRKTSIDELPQIINILKGEMSFIGPRPFLINDLKKYTKYQKIRFDVLPGITSWTAIHGRNNVKEQEKFNYEIYYVKNISFKLDIEIFIKTILVVLSGKNIDTEVNEQRIAAEIIEVMSDE